MTGRRSTRIAAALRSGGARLLDVHADEDHNRSVFTVVGSGDELVESLFAAIARAAELIDLRRHEGAHPRIGAADVVPLVPLAAEDEEHAREAAAALAERVGQELGLPVFLYGALGEGRGPAFFRKGGPAELQRRVDAGSSPRTTGRRGLSDSAGGVLIGVRPSADRVQREPARDARGGARDRRGSCARPAAASPACGRSAWSCRGPGSCR